MEIKPDFVSFETAKLLKEKGFEVPTLEVYDIVGELILWYDIAYEEDKFSNILTENLSTYYAAPEYWQVLKWLRLKHGIHVEIFLSDSKPYNTFYWRAMEIGRYFTLAHDSEYKDTPEEATELAIIYVLKNLI